MPTVRTFALAVLALVLASALGLFSQIRSGDDDAQLLDDARRLRELDTQIDRAVLASHDGIAQSYDELSAKLVELNATLSTTENVAARIDDPQLAAAMKRANSAVAAKALLIDGFESRNSMIRNSVAYLERAVRRVTEPSDAPRAAELTRQSVFVLACVMASENGDDSARLDLARGVEELTRTRAASPGPEYASVDAVLRHARIYMREDPSLDRAVDTVIGEDGRAFEALYEVAQGRMAHDARIANRVRVALAVALGVLLGVVAFIFGRLRQKRRELADINQHLEQRVALRTQDLEASREQYRALVESTQAIPWEMAPGSLRFAYVGPQAERILGYSLQAWQEEGFLAERLHPDDVDTTLLALLESQATNDHEIELRMIAKDGRCLSLRSLVSSFRDERGRTTRRGILLDVTARRSLEAKLSTAQKLESVGRLAAGVAHEINTPVQFVSDNVQFTRDALATMTGLLSTFVELVRDDSITNEARMAAAAKASEEADLDYLAVEAPLAIESSVEGLGRIASIVRSLGDFSHPDAPKMAPADLNRSLESTLTVARNEYVDIADLELDLGDLPPVFCHIGQINQVVLNLTINASHAIAAKRGHRGVITVQSRSDERSVLITIRDTGTGIPEHARGRLFDPFFTTKALGRGTGQGLSIARSIVVDNHGGELTFETDTTPGPSQGTTFFVRLPRRLTASEPATRAVAS